MSSHTRGPQRGHVPPHVRERLQAKRARAEARARRGPWYRRPTVVAPVTAVVFLLVGFGIGRATAPSELTVPTADAESLLFLSDQVELVWTSDQFGTPPVADALAALEGGDAAVVEENLDTWLQSLDAIAQGYDTSVAIVPAAEGPRLLFLEAAHVTREAVETLGAAATLEGEARALTLDTVRRLRLRAQELDRDARTLLRERTSDLTVVIPDVATEAPTLPRPTPAAPAPTEGATPSPTPSPADTTEATPEATP
ncbi:MAG: hypothetical protein ACRDUY_09755 [Nitriliruptorales bacterium]